MGGDWVTRQQAGELLHMDEDTVTRRVRAGLLVAVREGRRLLVERASVEDYLRRLAAAAAAKDKEEVRND